MTNIASLPHPRINRMLVYDSKMSRYSKMISNGNTFTASGDKPRIGL